MVMRNLASFNGQKLKVYSPGWNLQGSIIDIMGGSGQNLSSLGGHTGLRHQTLSGKLKLAIVMSDLIFWCRTVLNKKDQVAPKFLVHFSSSSWEISVPPLTNIYGWSWCVIGWLLTWKLRVKWISRSNLLSKCTSWYIIFNKFLEQAGAELCQAQYEIGDLNMISPLSLIYPASRAQCVRRP